jgi:hypothetical protein
VFRTIDYREWVFVQHLHAIQKKQHPIQNVHNAYNQHAIQNQHAS